MANSTVRLNSSMIDELKRSFRLRDYDNDGAIFSREIGVVVRSTKGLKPSEAEINEIVRQVDEMDGRVNLEQLVKLITSIVTHPEPDTPDELAEMFRMYDKEGKGLITTHDMKHVLTSVGEKLTDIEADDILKLSGTVERNMVNYNKFVKVIYDS